MLTPAPPGCADSAQPGGAMMNSSHTSTLLSPTEKGTQHVSYMASPCNTNESVEDLQASGSH